MIRSVQFTKRLKLVIAAILIAFAALALTAPQGQAQSGETCTVGNDPTPS